MRVGSIEQGKGLSTRNNFQNDNVHFRIVSFALKKRIKKNIFRSTEAHFNIF